VGRFQRLVLAGGFIYAVLLLPALVFVLPRMTAVLSLGMWAAPRGDGNFVTRAEPSTGLFIGDRVLSIDGDSRVNSAHVLANAWQRWPAPGGKVVIEVLGSRGRRTVTLPVRQIESPLSAVTISLLLLTSVAFFAVGVLMGWKRPELRAARVGWVAMTLCAIHFLGLAVNVLWNRGWEVPLPFAFLVLILPWHMAASYYFASMFPSGQTPAGRWRILTFIVVGLAPLYWVATAPYSLTTLVSGEPLIWLYDRAHWIVALGRQVMPVMTPLMHLATGAVLIYNYRRSSADDRRRIGWIIATSCVTLVAGVIGYALRYRSLDFLFLSNAAAMLLCPAVTVSRPARVSAARSASVQDRCRAR